MFSRVHSYILQGKQTAISFQINSSLRNEVQFFTMSYIRKAIFPHHSSLRYVFYIFGSHLALLSMEPKWHERRWDHSKLSPWTPAREGGWAEGGSIVHGSTSMNTQAGEDEKACSTNRRLLEHAVRNKWSRGVGRRHLPALPFNLRDGDRIWGRTGKHAASGNGK